MLRTLKLTIRSLGRAPSFATAVVLTLGLAIGATTAVFSVVRGVLLAPLPFRSPERLVRFFNAWSYYPSGSISGVEYKEDYGSLKTVPEVAAWTSTGANLTA